MPRLRSPLLLARRLVRAFAAAVRARTVPRAAARAAGGPDDERAGGGGPRDDRGARGEALAAAWLRRERGFTILVHNWRNPADRREEIDLVARDGEALVFIEVKTRTPGALVPGYYAVNRGKKRILRRAATAYLRALPRARAPRTFRFDVVEVVLPQDDEALASSGGPAAAHPASPEVLHFEGVRLFPKHLRGRD